jgi:hypothetical protein
MPESSGNFRGGGIDGDTISEREFRLNACVDVDFDVGLRPSVKYWWIGDLGFGEGVQRDWDHDRDRGVILGGRGRLGDGGGLV